MRQSGTVGFWRWRRNPLKRRSDVVEACVVLVVTVLMVCGLPLAGVLAGLHIDNELQHQREQRQRTTAVLAEDASTWQTGRYVRFQATVQWKAPDGTKHTAKADVGPESKAGSTALIWTDQRGELTGEPPTEAQAASASALAGVLAVGAMGAVVLGARWVVQLGIDRHRAVAWEQEWARVGPQWGTRRA
ncbi:Rv1733c family protein [Streptomyces sp. NPDC002577]